jgi:hypothetical protein
LVDQMRRRQGAVTVLGDEDKSLSLKRKGTKAILFAPSDPRDRPWALAHYKWDGPTIRNT